ncbi:glycosyltransferase family 2 protein [Ramlibacter sp. WS9]|uniref:glycosyltransferase family 2 protein n=1 Tax=Ramlibacter sp. WS9 TaxID=1882741 RepID=UPI0011448B03|nr:glycosyltransferase [Ramlibacter sp. WS9]ROZ66360.1 glycosyltransferase [Ramlibacter sp. WS9]
MSSPLVSFVMPCYGYGRYLRNCLDSILSLDGGYDIEIIAIHDASPDDTLAILKSYSDPRLKLIDHEVNQGHVISVNEGLQASRGKYVVRIDPDDRYTPVFLARTLPILERHPEVGLVYGDVSIINAEGVVTQERCDQTHAGMDFKGNELVALLKKNFICAPTVVARREAWMSAWPIPSGLAFNDWYFNLMLARRWEFYYVHEVLAQYRVHGLNHHTAIGKDGSEERSVLWLLDKIYGETEPLPELDLAKQRARGEVYAAQYLDFGLKYFGHEMHRDARRCLSTAVRYQPALLLDPRVSRLLLATYLPRPWYERIKKAMKKRMPARGSS